MSLFHGLQETKIIKTGDGRQFQQRKFYCSVHGWFDLFVFPDSEKAHEKCGADIQERQSLKVWRER